MKAPTLSFSGVSPRSMSSNASRSEEERYFFFFLWNWTFFTNKFCQKVEIWSFLTVYLFCLRPFFGAQPFLVLPSLAFVIRGGARSLSGVLKRDQSYFKERSKRPYISLIPPVGKVLVLVHVVAGKVVERLGHLPEEVCHGHRRLPPGAVLEYSGNMKIMI